MRVWMKDYAAFLMFEAVLLTTRQGYAPYYPKRFNRDINVMVWMALSYPPKFGH